MNARFSKNPNAPVSLKGYTGKNPFTHLAVLCPISLRLCVGAGIERDRSTSAWALARTHVFNFYTLAGDCRRREAAA